MTDLERYALETELRELLDERGIEYAESQDRFRTRFRFNYCEACGDYLNEIEIMGACITASKSYLTPDQAIAATLGNRALTAEQVQKVIYKHGINDGFVYSILKGSFQAIADELNAERHVETCRITASSTDGLCSDNPRHYFELSCCHSFTLDGLEPPNYCEVCGAKVVG